MRVCYLCSSRNGGLSFALEAGAIEVPASCGTLRSLLTWRHMAKKDPPQPKHVRPRGDCAECGDTDVPMGTATLCSKCYMRVRRESERTVVRHDNTLRREHTKLFALHTRMMRLFADFGLSDTDRLKAVALFRPYYRAIHRFLAEESHLADGK